MDVPFKTMTENKSLQGIWKDLDVDGFTWWVLAHYFDYIWLIIDTGEMHFIPSTPDAWFSLPRDGGVAYAAQESWVQNETIRDNILFGFPYDEQRYKKGNTTHVLF